LPIKGLIRARLKYIFSNSMNNLEALGIILIKGIRYVYCQVYSHQMEDAQVAYFPSADDTKIPYILCLVNHLK
jgi:hypothetical protein